MNGKLQVTSRHGFGGVCMWGCRVAWSSLCSLSLVGILSAQAPARVDFAKEVMPILRQNCAPCHGPAQQSGGMRLDRRSVVLGRRGVVPGSSENSFLRLEE